MKKFQMNFLVFVFFSSPHVPEDKWHSQKKWYFRFSLGEYPEMCGKSRFCGLFREKNTICPIYKNAHISWTLWATPMIFCEKTDFTKRDQEKKFGILKISPTSPTSPTNLPDEKMKKWHNFWMSLPIWLKFCMKVVEEYLHY